MQVKYNINDFKKQNFYKNSDYYQIFTLKNDHKHIIMQFVNNKLHNDEGPAIYHVDYKLNRCAETYCTHGMLHRDDGPARVIETLAGALIKHEYYLYGKRDRSSMCDNMDLPTYIWSNGKHTHVIKWHKDNKLHRIDGPAYIKYTANGIVEKWFHHGVEI